MDRVRKWLIHKLGGFSEYPIYRPNFVTQETCDVIPIAYRLKVGKDEFLKFPSYYKEKVCCEIAEGLLNNNLIHIEQNDDIERVTLALAFVSVGITASEQVQV